MAATSSVSQIHPKFPSSHSRILAISPKVPVTPAFLSPNFRLPCFPCQNALSDSWHQSVVSPATCKASQHLLHGSSQLLTCTQYPLLLLCPRTCLLQSHLQPFFNASLHIWDSLTLFMIQMALVSLLYNEHINIPFVKTSQWLIKTR